MKNRAAITFLLLFVTLSSTLFAQVELSICAIFQDEAPYLKEWIEFHKLQGIDHFYLYNNNSSDSFREVLKPYIQSHQVTLTEWAYTYEEGQHGHWLTIQTDAYRDCLNRFGKEMRWLAFIDIDEFLFCPDGKKLPLFLKDYRDFGGVGVNWIKFGTAHVEEIPSDSLLIELLTLCCLPEDKENRFYKSIVQPKHILDCATAHYFRYKKNQFAVDSNKKKMASRDKSKTILLDKIRLHHYWTRTEKYLREQKIPSRIKRRPQFTAEIQLQMAERYNEYRDLSILPFVPALKQAMGLYTQTN